MSDRIWKFSLRSFSETTQRSTTGDPRLAFPKDATTQDTSTNFTHQSNALQILYGIDLRDKTAIVTGANTGIGKTIFLPQECFSHFVRKRFRNCAFVGETWLPSDFSLSKRQQRRSGLCKNSQRESKKPRFSPTGRTFDSRRRAPMFRVGSWICVHYVMFDNSRNNIDKSRCEFDRPDRWKRTRSVQAIAPSHSECRCVENRFLFNRRWLRGDVPSELCGSGVSYSEVTSNDVNQPEERPCSGHRHQL